MKIPSKELKYFVKDFEKLSIPALVRRLKKGGIEIDGRTATLETLFQKVIEKYNESEKNKTTA